MSSPGRPQALPTDPGDRLHILDVLRGLALFGMFVVHFHVRTTEASAVDEAIRTLVWRLVETKSHGTFALLFGAGFAIQLGRAERAGRTLGRLYLRRLAVLAGFGVAAHLFFGFNVLVGYAVWGVPLFLMRRWSTRTLLVVAALSAASVALYGFASSMLVLLTSGRDAAIAAAEAHRAAAVAARTALAAAESQTSYAVVVALRLDHMLWFYRQPFSFLPGVTLALFIAGFLLVRHGVFESPGSHRRLLFALAGFGLVSWLADNWLLPALRVPTSFGLVRDQWLTFTYVSAILLWAAHSGWLVTRLRAVGAAGRMALTNYLLQIATLDVVFSAYGFGVGHVRPTTGILAATACFAAEVALSIAWLRRCRFGPAEWLWRSLTYGRRQPMRRTATVETAG